MEIAVPMPEAIGRFEKRLLADFTEKIQEGSRCRQDLAKWEDEHLLVDSPDPAKLVEHKTMVERLIFFGQVFAFITSRPDFPDSELAEQVQACLWVFREHFLMFHDPNPISKEEASRLLQQVFPEPRTGAAG